MTIEVLSFHNWAKIVARFLREAGYGIVTHDVLQLPDMEWFYNKGLDPQDLVNQLIIYMEKIK